MLTDTSDSTIPQASNLKTLLEILDSEFTKNKTIEGNVARLTKIMESYKSNAQDWKAYALFDPAKYTRNLVDDGNGRYNLIIECFNPGQESSVTDHGPSHCIWKTLHGELTETVYDTPAASVASTSSASDPHSLHIKKEKSFAANEVSYINSRIGLQNITNKASGPSVSLHLFSPPMLECKIYVPSTGVSLNSGKLALHSKYGEIDAAAKRRYSLNTKSNFDSSNDYYKNAGSTAGGRSSVSSSTPSGTNTKVI